MTENNILAELNKKIEEFDKLCIEFTKIYGRIEEGRIEIMNMFKYALENDMIDQETKNEILKLKEEQCLISR